MILENKNLYKGRQNQTQMPWKKILINLVDHERYFHETKDLGPFVDYLARLHSMFERNAREERHSPIDNAQLLELVGEYNSMIRNLDGNLREEYGFYRIGYRGGRREDLKWPYDSSNED